MTLKDAAVYVSGAIGAIFALAMLYWAWMYIVGGWGVYALSNMLKMGIVTLFFAGLIAALRREPSES